MLSRVRQSSFDNEDLIERSLLVSQCATHNGQRACVVYGDLINSKDFLLNKLGGIIGYNQKIEVKRDFQMILTRGYYFEKKNRWLLDQYLQENLTDDIFITEYPSGNCCVHGNFYRHRIELAGRGGEIKNRTFLYLEGVAKIFYTTLIGVIGDENILQLEEYIQDYNNKNRYLMTKENYFRGYISVEGDFLEQPEEKIKLIIEERERQKDIRAIFLRNDISENTIIRFENLGGICNSEDYIEGELKYKSYSCYESRYKIVKEIVDIENQIIR